MLNIDVKGFRGIKHAHIMCAPIALLCGPNYQGKSSTLEAVRAALDGDKQPYKLTKDELVNQLIHDGDDEATIHLGLGEDRYIEMSWPSDDVATGGAPLRATKFATGSLAYTALESRERDKVLAEYLKTDPTREEFDEAVEDLKLGTDGAGAIWIDIKQQGWDGAWAKHKTEGTKLKGVWENLTRGSYGSKVGGTWRPKGWTPEHEALTGDELKADMDTAQQELEAGIGKVAINADERKKLEGLALQIPKLQEALKTRKADLERAEEAKTQAQKAVQKIPVLPKENWPVCPHCAEPIQVMAGEVLKKAPAPLSPAKRKEVMEQLEKAQDVLNKAVEAFNEANGKYQTVVKDMQAAKDSKERLETADENAQSINLDELRGEVARIKSIMDAKENITKVLQAHIHILNKVAIVNVLAPEGLRKTKLADKVGHFNAQLKELCDIAEWEAVTVDENGSVWTGKYRYRMTAESERMRADIILQMAFATLDGSEIVLIDRADTLDGKGRNGLFALLQHVGLYAVVAMMLVRIKEAPDLGAAEIGNTFWIHGAQAMPLAKALDAISKQDGNHRRRDGSLPMPARE